MQREIWRQDPDRPLTQRCGSRRISFWSGRATMSRIRLHIGFALLVLLFVFLSGVRAQTENDSVSTIISALRAQQPDPTQQPFSYAPQFQLWLYRINDQRPSQQLPERLF